jgi:hypothetical protein
MIVAVVNLVYLLSCAVRNISHTDKGIANKTHYLGTPGAR